MSTYSQLLTDLTDFVDNDEVAAKAPTLVTLAESRHKRDLRLRDMIRRSVANGQDSRFLPLPSTEPFLEMRRLRLIDGNRITLQQVAPEALRIREDAARPYQYAVHQEIEFNQTLASSSSVEMLYYTPFAALSQQNQTNWLIENAYDVYLFAALAEVGAYIYEDERVPGWASKYQLAKDTLQREDVKGRVNQGSAQVTIGSIAGATP